MPEVDLHGMVAEVRTHVQWLVDGQKEIHDQLKTICADGRRQLSQCDERFRNLESRIDGAERGVLQNKWKLGALVTALSSAVYLAWGLLKDLVLKG